MYALSLRVCTAAPRGRLYTLPRSLYSLSGGAAPQKEIYGVHHDGKRERVRCQHSPLPCTQHVPPQTHESHAIFCEPETP